MRETEEGEEGLRQNEMLLHVYLVVVCVCVCVGVCGCVCVCLCLVVIRTTKKAGPDNIFPTPPPESREPRVSFDHTLTG